MNKRLVFGLVALLVCLHSAPRALAQAARLQLRETDHTLSIYRGDDLILSYNLQAPQVPAGIDPVYARSGFIHPVRTPGGRAVTGLYPPDHAHQSGIFCGWVSTTFRGQQVDFWNIAGGSGRVLHEKVVSRSPGYAIGFEVDLLHRANIGQAVDVLRERWKVTMVEANDDYYCFDIDSTQENLTDDPLIVNQYHYGGMAYRGPSAWLTGKEQEGEDAAVFMRNDQGSDRIAGNHQPSRWVTISGELDGRPAALTIFCHPQNLRAPQPARLHPTKPYFVFSPCVVEAFQIAAGEPLHSQYRYLVTDHVPSAGWLEARWDDWVGKQASSR